MAPAPRKCDTPGCTHPPAVPERVAACQKLAQSDGAPPAWVWRCLCEWTRYMPEVGDRRGEGRIALDPASPPAWADGEPR